MRQLMEVIESISTAMSHMSRYIRETVGQVLSHCLVSVSWRLRRVKILILYILLYICLMNTGFLGPGTLSVVPEMERGYTLTVGWFSRWYSNAYARRHSGISR